MKEKLSALIERFCQPNSGWKLPDLPPEQADIEDDWYNVRIAGAMLIYRKADIGQGGNPTSDPVLIIYRKSREELDEMIWPKK